MGWRSVVITKPARLAYRQNALEVAQDEGTIRVPLEDISVLVIDQPQVSLTAQLLSACAESQVVVITVGADHHPNGVLLPHLPHSRALKVMRAQLAMSQPRRKRLWQHIVQRKIRNQSDVLDRFGHEAAARRVRHMVGEVRSGDAGHHEAQAARIHFQRMFGDDFSRSRDCLHNAALNYGYSVVRSALARDLVAYGFLTAFGLHHRSEQNAFNLADDLLEPFRPIVDSHVVMNFPLDVDDRPLTRDDKARLVNLLHRDVDQYQNGDPVGRSTVLASIEAAVVSLSRRLDDDEDGLTLPGSDVRSPVVCDSQE